MMFNLPDDVMNLFESMVRIRAFEQRALDLFQRGLIRASVHPCIGTEAIPVGVCASLRTTDRITSTHRGHGHAIAKGLAVNLMLAEILGRRTGYCRGKGGSMHITSMEHGMLGADGVVAGSLGIAVGAAYASRLRGEDSVVVAFFGDGAANEGMFHEALNLGAVLCAPVVFVCENNQWALSTPVSATTPVRDIGDRAQSYGMIGHVVDGNDVLAVRSCAAEAIASVRSGSRPVLIEAKTYRITSHSAFSSGDDRPAAEIDAWKARDPIERTRSHLLDTGVSAADLDSVRDRVAAEIDDAERFALESEYPDAAEAMDSIYSAGVVA